MNTARAKIWVIDQHCNEGTLERIGDARGLADRLACQVAALVLRVDDADSRLLIQCGADIVFQVEAPGAGINTKLAAAGSVFQNDRPLLILAAGDCDGREWASRLAAKLSWRYVSPALMVQAVGERLVIFALDGTGKYSRRVESSLDECAVVTLAPGVAERRKPDPDRVGQINTLKFAALSESISLEQRLPADPETVDIRFADRLVAGGRGVGGRRGFATLQQFAKRLRASIAASRMAVDLGWIEYERQVGQTGKQVAPELYIACGISGATHHLEGMSEAKHIVAINTDPQAPIFNVAHLGLVADLHELLVHALKGISQ